MMRTVVLFSLLSGAILTLAQGSLGVSGLPLFASLASSLSPGDVLVADRGFGCYLLLALLQQGRGVDFIGRTTRRVDGRRRLKRLANHDWLILWTRGTQPSPWLTALAWAGLPLQIILRAVKGSCCQKGFRVRQSGKMLQVRLMHCITYPLTMSGPDDQSSPKSDASFTTTHWSVVVAAGQPDSPRATEALETLCRTYWYPLYAYLRRRGYRAEDAQDLTQEFFAQLLRKNYPAQADRTKGKFRSFLLLTLDHFLSDQHERAAAGKRGGGQALLSLDTEAPEERYRLEPPDDATPEKLFERRWAHTLLDQADARLREEYATAAKAETYGVLQAFEPGEPKTLSYTEAAGRLGVSESAIKSMIHRLRQRHGELVREAIAQTVTTASEINEELRHLIAVLSE